MAGLWQGSRLAREGRRSQEFLIQFFSGETCHLIQQAGWGWGRKFLILTHWLSSLWNITTSQWVRFHRQERETWRSEIEIKQICYLVDKLQRTHNGCDKQILEPMRGLLLKYAWPLVLSDVDILKSSETFNVYSTHIYQPTVECWWYLVSSVQGWVCLPPW